MMIVAKFGGSSLADAAQFCKVKDIVASDFRRQIVVPSAPGKRFAQDEKITDLLYRCHAAQLRGESAALLFSQVRERYLMIARQLGLSIDIGAALDTIEAAINAGASADYCASRGEYLNGLLLADYLGFAFLDAAEAVRFDENGILDAEATNRLLGERLHALAPVVLPGFYGSDPAGNIRVFSRGGSDITGALAARAVCAERYENWTDVSGFLMADPRIVPNPRPMENITYHEMHELSRAGATVLHEDSVFPVSRAGIPTNIRNTNQPGHPGTMITPTAVHRDKFSIFAGIAGKKGFCFLIIEQEPGRLGEFPQRVLQTAKSCALPFQYLQSSADRVCLIVNTERYEAVKAVFRLTLISSGIDCTCSVQPGFACIVLVGYGIIHNHATVNRVYETLRRSGINVAMITQSVSEISTWVSVPEDRSEDAVRALYDEFLQNKREGGS